MMGDPVYKLALTKTIVLSSTSPTNIIDSGELDTVLDDRDSGFLQFQLSGGHIRLYGDAPLAANGLLVKEGAGIVDLPAQKVSKMKNETIALAQSGDSVTVDVALWVREY